MLSSGMPSDRAAIGMNHWHFSSSYFSAGNYFHPIYNIYMLNVQTVEVASGFFLAREGLGLKFSWRGKWI